MMILEVHNEYVTWPEEFALMMMEHYRNHGIPYVVHDAGEMSLPAAEDAVAAEEDVEE